MEDRRGRAARSTSGGLPILGRGGSPFCEACPGRAPARKALTGVVRAFAHEHQADLSGVYARENLCITDDAESLRHDTQLVRRSPGTPRHVHVYGFLHDVDRERLEPVVDDPPPSVPAPVGERPEAPAPSLGRVE